MPDSAETLSFIKSTFRSVWSLELLCVLKDERDRTFSATDLVDRLRASQLVVQQSIESLVAGGLVAIEEGGRARYAPASPDLERLADAAHTLYRRKPDAVRRLIVLSGNEQLTAFADAFRLRKD
jgi:DNA-binding FadR family transcriptional regulator